MRYLYTLCCLIFLFYAKEVIVKAEDNKLPKYIVPNTYIIHLTIPDVDADTYTGNTVITFESSEETNKIYLHSSPEHITLTKVNLNGDVNNCSWNYVSIETEIIEIVCPNNVVTAEVNSIQVYYNARFETRTGEGLYKITYVQKESTEIALVTHLSPIFARRVFPCFDEPHLKAVFNIFIKYPRAYKAIGNTPYVSEMVSMDSITTQFETIRSMSTHSLGFVISKFAVPTENIEMDNFVYDIFSRSGLKATTITALTYGTSLITQMEEWTGIRYIELGNPQIYAVAAPYLQHATSNSWGLVIAREENLLDEELNKTSAIQQQTIIKTLGNLIADQWFGHYITPNLWNNKWLSEGFSKFFEYYLPQRMLTWNQFSQDVLQEALYEDILQAKEQLCTDEELVTSSQILSKVDDFIGLKGACILRMMQFVVGDETFQDAIRSYINRTKLTAYNPAILLEALGLQDNMEAWLSEPGYPLVTVNVDDKGVAILSQEPFFLIPDDRPDLIQWSIPITYTTREEKDFDHSNISWWKSDTEFRISLQPDSWLILNKQQMGYFRVNYEDSLWVLIIEALYGTDRSSIHVLNRAQLIDDIFILARAGKVDYQRAFELLQYLKNETEYYPWNSALNIISWLMKRVNTEEGRTLLKANILSLIDTAFPNLNEIGSTKHIDIIKESLILNWKCLVEDSDCINSARSKFEDFKSTQSLQNYNERPTILCYGMKYSNNPIDDYSNLIFTYRNSESPLEKQDILAAIGCSTNQDVLTSFLSLLITDNSMITLYDAIKVFASVSSQTHASDVALSFLNAYIVVIIEKYEGILSMSDFLIDLVDTISTWDQLEQLQKIIESNEKLQSDRNIRLLKIAESNLQWSGNYTETITYIMLHPSDIGGKGEKIEINIHLLLMISISFLLSLFDLL